MNKARFPLALAILSMLLSVNMASALCVDSIRLVVHPVQCNGLRNGEIYVERVFGGEKPFYFSLDSLTFSTRPQFDRLWPGTYKVYVRDASGCVKGWTAEVTEPELLQVKLAASDTSVVAGEPLHLSAVTSPENTPLASIEWRPPALFQKQETLQQSVRFAETTTFAIEIANAAGCLARDQVTVKVEKTNVYFPNVLKPSSNQDAFFTIYAGEGVAKVSLLQVYSRNGSLIFERRNFSPNDPLEGWNGRWREKIVSPGVYSWLALVEYLDGHQERFQGSLTVVN